MELQTLKCISVEIVGIWPHLDEMKIGIYRETGYTYQCGE